MYALAGLLLRTIARGKIYQNTVKPSYQSRESR